MKPQDIKDAVRDLDPLTDEQLRQLWTAAPYPEVRRLMWEIRRLQETINRNHETLMNIASGYSFVLAYVDKTAVDLVSEPCVRRRVQEQVAQAMLERPNYSHALNTIEDYKTWLQSEIDTAQARRGV